ncbi:MAG: c-type cytochrome domain-containing protein, partial [Akkermansiaceae bacterium]
MSCRLASLLLLVIPGFAVSADKITYDDHIFPIFESKCLNCHNPDKKKGDLDLSTYSGTMTGSSGGKIALAGDGGSSKLYTVTVHTEEPVMPPEGDKISKKNADLIRAWIDGGLLENKGSKAKKREKPAFTLSSIPTGKKPEGPPPMPEDLLLEPVITPSRATVVADMQSSPWAPLLAVTAPRQVLLYHTDSLELVGILPFPKGSPETLSFHPGGKYLLAGGGIGGKSGTTVTWDITTGEILMTMGREFDSVLAADLRADLGGVAMGGPSRLVKLWDPAVDEQIKSIKKHTDWVTALAYSPDGVLLATGDRNNGVQVWEAATGNEFHSLRG